MRPFFFFPLAAACPKKEKRCNANASHRFEKQRFRVTAYLPAI
jgi:hypothetical protein